VVSPVRVRVSPFPKSPANRGVLLVLAPDFHRVRPPREPARAIRGQNPLGGHAGIGAVELLAGIADEAVELGPVRALYALLELGIDVERHLGVGTPDLAHDPLDVEVVRQQHERDVRATEAVRCRARQRRKTTRLPALGRECRGLTDDLRDALAREAASPHGRDEISVGTDARPGPIQPVEMLDDGRDEVEA